LVVSESDLEFIEIQLDKALKQAKLLHKALKLKAGLEKVFK